VGLEDAGDLIADLERAGVWAQGDRRKGHRAHKIPYPTYSHSAFHLAPGGAKAR
jgi:hypothetical protein